MRLLSVTLGLALLATAAWAQAEQLTDLKVTKETVLGSLKSVEGTLTGPQPGSSYPPHEVTVWVNGYATRGTVTGGFKVLVPNEPVTSVVAWQPKLNVIVELAGRDLARVRRFKALASQSPEIRDLLNNQPQQDVVSGGGDGGIRDLLAKPSPMPGQGEVTSGGGDGGIRDLLAKPVPVPVPVPAPVNGGGGDGGIRDLLNKPAGGQ